MFVIARFYKTANKARAAVSDLKKEGFRPNSYTLITPVEVAPPTEEGAMPSVKTVRLTASAMRAGQLLGEHADFYAKHLKEGQSLVVVQPPFGGQRLATAILDRHGPLGVVHERPKEEEKFVPISKKAAPLSAWLGWNVLSDKPAPFSEYWGFNTKSSGRSFLSRWFPELSSHDYALFGSNNLIRKAAPLSAMFAMPTLSGKSGDSWTTSMGFPILSRGSAPLSDSLGLPLLSRKRWTY
jgi:hypothetical protein